jgi:uncharacterized membrane protein YedE/YeeE
MPITEDDLATLRATVLWSTFALAFAFGAVAQRTRFCTMGAVADLVNFGDTTRLRQWLLAIAVAIAGTHLLAAGGLIDLGDSFHTAPRLLLASHLIGGFLFGFGMVLAGGCGSRTLVRIGAGSLKSLVVFLVLGLSAYVSLRGALAVVRVEAIEPLHLQLGGRQDLAALLARATGAPLAAVHLATGLAVGGLLAAVALAPREFRTGENLAAGLTVGGVIAAVWFVSGHIGHVAEHPRTLEEAFVGTYSGRMESLTFVAPVAHTLDWLMFFSDRSNVLTLGVVAVFGMIAGAAAVALATRQFRWEGFRDTEDTANHLVGATLMGFGGVTALGCTIGQGLTGISTLAIGSWLATAAIVAGAVAALKYQQWRLERLEG